MNPPFEKIRSQEQLIRRESYALKNKLEELVGRVEVDYRDGEFLEHKREQIIKFIISSIDGRTVDLFEFIGLSCQVFITEDSKAPYYDPRFDIVFIHRPIDPESVAAAMHEFGHAIQHQDPKFRKICQMAERKIGHSTVNTSYWPEMREKLLLIQSELDVSIDSEIIDNIDRAYQAYKATERHADNEDQDLARAKKNELHAAFVRLAQTYKTELQKVFMRPENVLEIDATRRAVKWMRRIAKEFAINFIKNAGSLKELETALSTYLKK